MFANVFEHTNIPFVLITLLCGLCAAFGPCLFAIRLRAFKNNAGVAVILTLCMQAIIPILFFCFGDKVALGLYSILSLYLYWAVLTVTISLRKKLPVEVIVE